MSVTADEAVAGLVNDLIGEESYAAPEFDEPGEQPTEQAEPALSYEADLTGLDFLDDEPEPEPEDDYEEPDETFDEIDLPTEGEYVDPGVAKLVAQNKKLQARVEYERQLRSKAKQKDWKAEAQRRFPLADADTLKGESRRAMLRDAKAQHDRVYKKILPVIKQAEAARAGVLEDARLEGRARAEQAWGRPTSGPSVTDVEAAETADRNQHDRRKYRTVYESVNARFKKGLQI